MQGDGMCDDLSNTAECDWDGGDCCDPNADFDVCTECFCADQTFGGNNDVDIEY